MLEHIKVLPRTSLLCHIPVLQTPPFLSPPHTGLTQCHVAASSAGPWYLLSLSGWHDPWKSLPHSFQDSVLTLASSTTARRQRAQNMSLQTLGRVTPFLQVFCSRGGKIAWTKAGCDMRLTCYMFKIFALSLWVQYSCVQYFTQIQTLEFGQEVFMLFVFNPSLFSF